MRTIFGSHEKRVWYGNKGGKKNAAIYICGCDYEEVGKKLRWRLGVPAFKREKRLSPPLRATCDADGYHRRSRRIDLPAPLAQPIVNRTFSAAKLQLGAVEAPVFNTIKHAYRV